MILRRLLLVAILLGPIPALADGPPLRTAVDGTFAPHAFPKLDGGVQGFNVDLFTEVAHRMGRPITIDSASFSGLVPAMNAGRYDFLAAPTTVTPERAQNMLFTQGYLWTAYQFGIRKGSKPITGWADLAGKIVSVNKGTPYEILAKQQAEKFGFTRRGVRYAAGRDPGGALRPRLCDAGRQHGDQIRGEQEPEFRRRPRAQRHPRPLGRAVPAHQRGAARPGRRRV